MSLGITMGIGLSLSQALAGALDPRTVPALMAGGIWLPGVGVTSLGGGDFTWASQATQANVLTTVGALEKATQSTASNGAAVWNMSPVTYAQGFNLTTPGSALRFATKGTYAFWLKETADEAIIRYILDMWPDGATDQRLYIYHNNTVGKMSINGSDNGTGTSGDGSHRWKANYININFAQWNFIRFTFNWDLANYTSSGANFSYKMKVYVNEVFHDETTQEGYSAPPPPFSTPPSGPVIGSGLYTGAGTRFSLCNNNAGSGWKGQVGPVYCANEEIYSVNETQWGRIMLFNRPA